MNWYKNIINNLKVVGSILHSQSGARAQLHSVGEVTIVGGNPNDYQVVRNDNPDDIFPHPVVIKVINTVDDKDQLRIMYKSGQITTLNAWKLKVSCTEVVKIFATPKDIADDDLFLSL